MMDASTSCPERVLLVDVDLEQVLPTIQLERQDKSYPRAHVLLTIGGYPFAGMDVHQATLTPDELAALIWQHHRLALEGCCRDLGRAVPDQLTARGLGVQGLKKTPSAQPFISVVVCTRDRAEIASSLDALLVQNYQNYELIVVDNAPRTNTTAELIRYGYAERIRYVREDRPGLSWARNCGLQAARGEIIAFTDDDAYADPNWLTELARGFARGLEVVCVTGLCLPFELETPAQVLFQTRAEEGGFSQEFARRVYDLEANRPSDPLFPFRASKLGAGMNMAFRKSFLLRMGGFATTLGAGSPAPGGEDLAAFFEVIVSGHRLAYEPGAIVRHVHRNQLKDLRRHMRGYGEGFTAYLLHVFLRHPTWFFRLLAQLPNGLKAIQATSAAGSSETTYVAELARLERTGWLTGPLAYVRSVFRDLKFRLRRQTS